MNEINPRDIALANNAISEAIKNEVKKEVDDSIAVHAAFTNVPELLESIKSIPDPKQQAELLDKYLGILGDHQKVKNKVLSKLVDNGIEKNNKILNNEIENNNRILNSNIEKDQIRTSIFGNRLFLIFLMIFPIIFSIFIVAVSKSFWFATFIILMWYGMILALYFSQSDALNKLLQNFLIKK